MTIKKWVLEPPSAIVFSFNWRYLYINLRQGTKYTDEKKTIDFFSAWYGMSSNGKFTKSNSK